MKGTTLTKTIEERRKQALDKLAEIGGMLKGEEDVVRQGTKYVLPAHSTLDDDITFLVRRRDDEENSTNFVRTFPYRPNDGARATKRAIEEFAGFAVGMTIHGFFSRQLPTMVDIAVGPHEREAVPSGAMTIPGLPGLELYLGSDRDPELGEVFQVVIEAPRKYRFHVTGLFELIEKHLRTGSIYKGKAIDGAGNFIDVSVIDRDRFVFTESVQRRLEGDVWAFLHHEKLLAELGQDGKFAALFAGDYGVGKSAAALITAQEAVAHNWTFLMCRPGKDSLETTLEMARMYPPCIVFAEDIDTAAGPQSGSTIERYLDLLDGVKQKGLKMLALFTTNHPEDIHQGMLRPGRIGAVIRFGAMDRPGVEKLARVVIGDALDPGTDFDKVFTHVDGYLPAFVRAVFDRAVRYAITLNNGRLGKIGTEAICLAADSLRDQHDLMAGAKEELRQVDLATALEHVVVDAVEGMEVHKNDGTKFAELTRNGG